MKKNKTVFICQECGSNQSKWVGKCPDCGTWSSFVEETIKPKPPKRSSPLLQLGETKPEPMGKIQNSVTGHRPSGIGELDRVLGGGVVDGSLVLIGGDPGIGKSTLVLQLCGKIAKRGDTVLYVTGEESASQVKMRGERLGVKSNSILIYPETSLELVIAEMMKIKPSFVVVDSIQTVYTQTVTSAPGSVSQLRESTALLMQACKTTNIPLFLVGHVTKEGAIAGPRVLEHMVDTVLYFEGDRDRYFRILRSVKNRFGSTHEIGVFEMLEEGLKEVKNPSEVFISGDTASSSGSVITASLSGTRPILVEIQALVTPANFGNARRTAVGFDYNRLILLSAIMQKRGGLLLDTEDIYLSVAGGIKIDDPGSDVAVCASIAGSFRNLVVGKDTIFIGEVGLGGEARPVSSIDLRLREAERMGMKRAVIPKAGNKDFKPSSFKNMEIVQISDVGSILDFIG